MEPATILIELPAGLEVTNRQSSYYEPETLRRAFCDYLIDRIGDLYPVAAVQVVTGDDFRVFVNDREATEANESGIDGHFLLFMVKSKLLQEFDNLSSYEIAGLIDTGDDNW